MKRLLVLLFSFLTLTSAFAEEAAEGGKFEPGPMILHHIADDYLWEFAHGVELYLPVILWDNGELVTFSSSNFYNEDHERVPYKGYAMLHGHIFKVGADGEVLEDYPGLYNLSITKNIASMFISVALLLVIFFVIAARYKKNPGKAPSGIQSFFEPIIIFIRDDIAKANIGPKYERYMPFLLTVFFFIWFNNLLGLMPGGANLTGNISVTAVLAVIVLVVTVFSGNKTYWGHIFATPGVPRWLAPIMIPVELLGIITKPFALMVRLFANITAGHIIILSLFSLIFIFESLAVAPLSVAFAIFMNFLELFVALLQAYIFTLLSAMYFGGAVEEHDHAEGHH
ncbi:ATP synthase F0 subcomplex A subunit [Pontibacter ummariensis]|uniref:ATP synthase subunit a n=1 Tax=Pontibacter ummariensis TaxID=1610492 RepID=A0A239CUP8_9BACT|nr:F0F1 ATP synthase subunit A [Pontibacter ummariensis]PRY14820.1 ATP synthase F0 subcomplex A subunit [Pontibacter ummariensis]SNS23797.1 ATP synthase F0 subcomplex A subunit [Pontibacter ummariensis]